MMRSLFSGVAGLRTHQTRMDVIGNNIANVNTTAYKSQSMVFSDLMYQTTRAASGANATTGVGGVNARQIGLGSKTSSIKTAIASQGSAQSTNDPFDIMISGSSFFVVSNGSENFFTRDGSFYIDGKGNLAMTSTGYNVMGWQVDPTNPGLIKKDTVSPLRLMTTENMTYPPAATTLATVDGLVDKYDTDVNSDSGRVMNLEFFDNQGYKYTARLSVHALSAEANNAAGGPDVAGAATEAGTFYVKLDDVLDSKGDSIMYELDDDGNFRYDNNGNKILTAVGQNISFGQGQQDITLSDGTAIKEMVSRTVTSGNPPTTTVTKTAENVKNALVLQYVEGKGTFAYVGDKATASGATPASSNGTGVLTLGAANFQNITLDFSGSFNSNKNGTSTIGALAGDPTGLGSGRKVGELTGITVAKDGMINANYDNGQTKLLGQIAVANFANPSGLAKEGDNLYSATMNSGEFDGIGDDITEDGGYMESGVLEMSNVDLASEFTEMITTQRGFQANSRIITVSDTLLEELTNLKR